MATNLYRKGGCAMHHSRRSLQQIDHCLRQILPEKGRKHLLRFLPLAVLGVILSCSCHLNRIAVALPFAGGAKAVLQRLRRWMMRETFALAEILPLLARAFLSGRVDGPIALLVDRTQWQHANLLYAAVSFRGRALPVAVMILDGPKATNHTELAGLLEQAAVALPREAEVVVVADREFGNIPAIKVIRRRGWHFCLRFKHDTWLYAADGSSWQARDAYPARRSRVLWSALSVTLSRYGPLQVAIYWHQDEDEPWVLVSDLQAERLVGLYRQRMRIDEMFSDLKGRGFDLEATRLRDPDRLLRLAALLSLVYLWLLMVASVAVRRGLRRCVDPAKRRALSYLQIGLRLLRHHPPELAHSLQQAACRLAQPK